MRMRRDDRGFTLTELMLVVAIIGILASIAIPAFTRYLRKARSAEAAEMLNKIWAGSVAYYETDHPDSTGEMRPKQFPGPTGAMAVGVDCGCLPAKRCPGGQPAWNTDVWMALNFSLPDSHSYLPGYTAAGAGTSAQFTAVARGDLDCDGVVARYERYGRVSAVTGDVSGNAQPVTVNELE